MTVLFWGFANEITRLGEARRFYSVLSIASNFAAIAAGLTSIFVSDAGTFNPNIPLGNDSWEQTMMILMILIIFSGVATMVITPWQIRHVPGGSAFAGRSATIGLPDDLAQRESQQDRRTAELARWP